MNVEKIFTKQISRTEYPVQRLNSLIPYWVGQKFPYICYPFMFLHILLCNCLADKPISGQAGWSFG